MEGIEFAYYFSVGFSGEYPFDEKLLSWKKVFELWDRGGIVEMRVERVSFLIQNLDEPTIVSGIKYKVLGIKTRRWEIHHQNKTNNLYFHHVTK